MNRQPLLLLAALACACGSGHPAKDARLATAAGDSGAPDVAAGLPDVVFSMGGHVDGGGEMLDCLYVRMPSDRGKIAVGSAESHYTPGSHHFLVYRTTYDAIPAGGDQVHPCTDAEQIVRISGTYYEAQAPDAERVLPAGVAHVFAPGEILLLTAHYLNPGVTGFDTQVTFRLHTMDPDLVKHVAGSIFFYNPSIEVPPQSDVTVTRSCPISQDIDLALLWSHMHSRGVAFAATSDDPSIAPGAGNLYTSTTWSEPSPRVFPADPPVVVHGGSRIAYSCTYHNPTANSYVAGQSAATNEMCILHGMYWPRLDTATELCLTGQSVEDGLDAGTGAGQPEAGAPETDGEAGTSP